MRLRMFGLVALSLLVPLGVTPAQTLEERVRRLEAELESLRRQLPVVAQSGNSVSADTAPPMSGGLVRMPAVLAGNEHVRWGFPGGSCAPLPKEFFIICHDGRLRVPEWVTYHLTRADLAQSEIERSDDFRPDTDLDPQERSELAHYRNSGYDRGHMAPAADFKRSAEAMSSTFFMSNMAPQRPHLNRRAWAQLEDLIRQLGESHGSIWIFTGVLYLDGSNRRADPPEFIAGRVGIPTHFYKVILCEHDTGGHEMYAYLMPNQLDPLTDPLDDFVVSVADVERLSGLDFFAVLPDGEERRLQRSRNPIRP